MSTLLGGAAPSSGTKAARISAIKAELLNSSFLKTTTNGDKYVAANELVAWLRAQFISIATTDSVPVERQEAVAAMGVRVDIVPKVLPWSNLVSRDYWSTNPAWPAVSELANEEKTAAFIKTVDSLKSASTRLTDHFEGIKSQQIGLVPEGYDYHAPQYLPEITVRVQDTRAYIYTYVNDWGWESAPSDPSDVKTVDNNDIITITAPAPPSGRNIAKMRLYRSASGNKGAAFQFVIENATNLTDGAWASVDNRQYIDNLGTAELQEVCPSMLWIEPPVGLKGLKAMPNGVMVGFEDNSLFFSEPFKGYAWPKEYRLTTEHRIVGIGVFGQTAAVLTEGFPYYVSGADAATMSAQKLEFPFPCVAKRSIASVDGGVIYASPDGLCLATAAGITNLIAGAVSRADWQTWLGAQNNWVNAFGGYHEGIYYMFNSAGAGYALDLTSKKLSALTQLASGVYSDLITDKLYVVSGTSLLDLFGGGTLNTAVWKSRVFVMAGHPGFSCLRVESDFASAVTVKVYGDGVLRHTATFTDRLPQRLPPGRYRDFEVQVEAACQVTRVTMATTMTELAQT